MQKPAPLLCFFSHNVYSSLNMVKVASTFKQQKHAKQRNKIYSDAEEQKPSKALNASKDETNKVN
jgi:hypothetical protein